MTRPISSQVSAQITQTSAVAAESDDQPFGVVLECDVAQGIPAVEAPRSGAPAFVLVRLFSEPLGMLTATLPAEGLKPNDLGRAIAREFEPGLRERFAECGLTWDGELPSDGLNPPRTPRFLASRERVLREGPRITAAVCTRGRPDTLGRLLASLSIQEYKRMRILVVDNAPTDEHTRKVVLKAAQDHKIEIDYVIEPRPGLSWARNRAIDASDGEVIALVDDDEVCDRWWAAELARAYVEVPEAGGVSGVIVPGELMTESQLRFDNYSAIYHSRGFTRAVFSPGAARKQSPLYPLPPFGSGGNMSFRREALKQIRGFDNALGAGTVTKGGEDTAALSALQLAGGTVVYQPTAIVHHYHQRSTYSSFYHQFQGYGRGLTAFYTSMILRRPSSIVELLRLSGQAVRDQFSHSGSRHKQLGEGFPSDMLRANRIGLLQGPFTYAAARLQVRCLRRAALGR